MAALKGKPDIGDQINKNIIRPIVSANTALSFDDFADFDHATLLGNGKEKVERISNLIAIFEDPTLDFSKNRADGDDILGDAYEYLMRHFATESGKSKGQFYTPAEVSRIMAQIIGVKDVGAGAGITVYDPTCGSGSLLLKVADETKAKVTLSGQEKDSTTSGLARMNMYLHNYPTAVIKAGNTLADPLFKDGDQIRTFDFVVANPPFSDKRWSNGVDTENDPHDRFKHFGTPPDKQGDYAYLLHIVRSLKRNGKGACILPHGVLFRGNAEGDIRRNLIKRGYIKAIVGLPANLFYGTGIPACIVLIDKQDAQTRKGIYMIDASAGFMKEGPKNRLRAQDIHRIVDAYNNRLEVPKFARMVPFSEIEKNDYNLNLPRYIDSQQAEDQQDIEGHLKGGIPLRDVDALGDYWKVCPDLRNALFKNNRAGYVDLAVDKAVIKSTIYDHPQFAGFITKMNRHFATWQRKTAVQLKSLSQGLHPKELIVELAEGLLEHYDGQLLIDKYDVYQHLMDYWAAVMQDDCYLIAADGWKAETYRVLETKKGKNDKPDKTVDKGWTCDLVPKPLIVARYFKAEQDGIDKLNAELEDVTAKLEELEEEYAGEEGVLADLDKIDKANITARLKEIKNDKGAKAEADVLNDWLTLNAKQSELKKQIKDTETELDTQALEKYPKLSEAEIKVLVVDDKWLAVIDDKIHGEMNRISQALSQRVNDVAERYKLPLYLLTKRAIDLEANMMSHLLRMGFK